ncbi:Fibrillin-1, partial [Geodia barretti]
MTDRNDSRVKRSWTCAMCYWLAWCLVLESAVLVTRAADLLPYDTHQQLPVGNEEAAQIPLTKPFVFLEQNYSALTVHSDGYISLQTTGSSPASKESDPVISVYLSDVDTSGIGQIYYGLETNNSYFLSQFELLVLIYFTNSFSPRELVVVTWSGVGYYQNGTDQTNTFQAVLATDGSSSYVYFLYKNLEWIYGSDTHANLPPVGFTDHTITYTLLPGTNYTNILDFNHYYLDSAKGTAYILSSETGTTSEHALALERLSNVAQQGLWIFRVDSSPIQSADTDECLSDPCDSNATCSNTASSYICECNTGFSGSGFTCTNINECENATEICDSNATCSDTQGSYECMCNTGYSGDGLSCTNCSDTAGSYECTCFSGYTGDGYTCLDIDECLADPCDENATCSNNNGSFTYIDECLNDPCDSNATCSNTAGSYICECNTGFSGSGFTCTNINECENATEICDSNATCSDTQGSYECMCNTGYSGDGLSCTNINECGEGTHNCDGKATCNDTEGSYECVCNTGYSGDGFICTNIDECSSGGAVCDQNADCSDTAGSYECTCFSGYTGDGYTCLDIDECLTHPCDENATCSNNNGSFTYIDECLNDPCDSNATCSNTAGSYICECNTGFSGSGFTCTNINECENATEICDSNATCSDTQGSYECMCNTGYSGDGLSCTNIDECSSGGAVCDQNADCSDTAGSYECTCFSGYTGDGYTCLDIDECLTHPCDENATCTNNNGSFTCQCNTGYVGNGTYCTHHTCFVSPDHLYECGRAVSSEITCEAMGCCYNSSALIQCYHPSDVDECSLSLDNCDLNAQCINLDDGYNCTCSSGYTGNGTACYDINECSTGSAECDENAECYDTAGSYDCTCFSGYIGDGYTCQDIDECLTHPCDENATCTNNNGSFSYTNECENVTEICDGNATCSDTQDTNECNLGIDACDGDATCNNTAGSYECVCNSGFYGNGLSCENVNECSTGRAECDENADCYDTAGSYECTCFSGYTGDGYTCRDIDECLTDPCDENATCTNTDGSYSCHCDNGFTGNGSFCFDVNECETGNNTCDSSATCIDTVGSYECECNIGYSGDGLSCSDIDECSTGSAVCDENADCYDTAGSYECTCFSGYTGDGYTCQDIDECLTHPCDENATCTNNNGSFSCQCNTGYVGNGSLCIHQTCFVPVDRIHECGSNVSSEKACEAMGCCYNSSADVNCYHPSDVNECDLELDNCHTHAYCANVEDGFTCTCKSGYTGDGLDCENVDECTLGTDTCDTEHADCIDSEGSYSCMCHIGYTGNGEICSCLNGSILLLNGSHISTEFTEGTVLVCFNNVYGTVCDDYWDELEAAVVCRQLGLTSSGNSISIGRAAFGEGSNYLILLDQLMCTGNENSLLDCAAGEEVGSHNCDHSEDAGVRCEAVCEEGDVRLSLEGNILDSVYQNENIDENYFIKDELARGRVEVCIGENYGTVCDDNWGITDASVVCYQLGFSRYGAIAVSSGAFGDDVGSAVLYSAGCSGIETEILSCSVSYSGTCSQHSAAVICQGSRAFPRAEFGEGSGMIYLEGIECAGDEEALLNCPMELELGFSSCDHSRDAGIRCYACVDGAVRLGNGSSSNEGRVEICYNVEYGNSLFNPHSSWRVWQGNGSILLDDLMCSGDESSLLECLNDNDIGSHDCSHGEDAGVRCEGSINVSAPDYFSEGISPGLMSLVNCSGTEKGVIECDHMKNLQGITCDPAGVVCQVDVVASNCTTGDVRLVGSANGDEGRLEVCVNGAWGTVCSDQFDTNDASVACQMLEGFNGTSPEILTSGFEEGSAAPEILTSGFEEGSDINECVEDTDTCDGNATCSDTEGGYECECNIGYSGGGFSCSNINECDVDTDMCDSNATCSDTEGGYDCKCNVGYSGDGFSCSNINECDVDTDMCDSNATCSDTEGGYDCKYINECFNASVCDENAECYDTAGSYECTCFSGYTGDGYTCQDIDECLTHPCDENATCTNNNGSFSCQCNTGYVGNGSLCIHYENTPADQTCFVPVDRIHECGSNVSSEKTCEAMGCCYNSSADINCYYPSDVDECDLELHNCHTLAYCVNVEDGFTCTCKSGYTGDGLDCENVDECTLGTDTCDTEHADCIDSEGSYSCTCHTGYTGNGEICSCLNGSILLLNGSDISTGFTEGTVLVCFNNVYGTVCDDYWDELEAAVVCRQLGLTSSGNSISIGRAAFGEGSNYSILLDQLMCTGNENSLLDCAAGEEVGSHNCDHSEDAGVRCEAVCEEGDVRLSLEGNILDSVYQNENIDENYFIKDELARGRVEVCIGGNYGTVCDDNWGITDASVVCYQLGFSRYGAIAVSSGAFGDDVGFPCIPQAELGEGSGMIYLEGIECAGDEDTLLDCPMEVELGFSSCDHSRDAGIRCYVFDLHSLCGWCCSLANGTDSNEGRVEICYNVEYGTVCDDFWDELETRVVCRQLGYLSGESHPIRHGEFGQGNGSILLDDLMCSGIESSLLECLNDNDVGSHDCSHGEDAGVNVKSTRGRVEVCIGGRYGAVCDEYWDYEDASVVCSQLGFSPHGSVNVSAPDYFSEGISPGLMSLVNCSGTEKGVIECDHMKNLQGITCDPAGVVCQGTFQTSGPIDYQSLQQFTTIVDVVASNCTTGDVRLVGSANGDEGRLEVCVNGAWGTVCSDQFDTNDASVACQMLEGFNGTSPEIFSGFEEGSAAPEILTSGFEEGSDINECDEDTDTCDGNATCSDTEGGYECECNIGYSGDGFSCSNINECFNGSVCDENAECYDTAGSYECTCFSGYTGDGYTCQDIDECLADPCDENAPCSNNNGSFSYINECDEDTDTCDGNATCSDTEGGYDCECNVGYSGDGFSCSNINECDVDTDMCDSNATCSDTEGGYDCKCNVGYSGDGFSCS